MPHCYLSAYNLITVLHAPLFADHLHIFALEHMQMVNKLLYRSKQRGFLELDLLVGLWAEENIPKMDLPTLQHMSVLLDQVRGRS